MAHANRRQSERHWVAAKTKESFYRYAATRFVHSWIDALDWIRMRQGVGKSVAAWGLFAGAHLLTLGLVAASFQFAGGWGLVLVLVMGVLTHWLVLGQQFLRHWGLGFQDSIGSESTWAWEMPNHWAGMVCLERSGGSMHYRRVATPYYALAPLKPSPRHRWVGLVMRLVILWPSGYRRMSVMRLRQWRTTSGMRGSPQRRAKAVSAIGGRRDKDRLKRQ